MAIWLSFTSLHKNAKILTNGKKNILAYGETKERAGAFQRHGHYDIMFQ